MDGNMLAPFDLTGRIALVTGGSGGIGRACVERLVAYGATVALTFVEGAENEAEVRAAFGQLPVTAHPLDLRKAESIRSCISAWGMCAVSRSHPGHSGRAAKSSRTLS